MPRLNRSTHSVNESMKPTKPLTVQQQIEREAKRQVREDMVVIAIGALILAGLFFLFSKW